MSRVPELQDSIPLPEEIKKAARDGGLVLFVGAGVSRLLGLPSWTQLAALVLEDLRQARCLNYSEIEQLRSLDPRKQLSIAKHIADENEFKLDISKHLIGKTEGESIYKQLNNIGCSCVTTNYDELLSPRYRPVQDGSETPVSVQRVSEREKFFAKLLNEPATVVHLHGCVSHPETMVVTTQDYLDHYDNENVKSFLNELFGFKTVVFLGYGLEEADILEHILRRSRVRPTKEIRLFAVQGFFKSQLPLYKNLYHYYKESFGVHLLGFTRDYDDHGGLQNTIKDWAEKITVGESLLVDDVEFMKRVLAT